MKSPKTNKFRTKVQAWLLFVSLNGILVSGCVQNSDQTDLESKKPASTSKALDPQPSQNSVLTTEADKSNPEKQESTAQSAPAPNPNPELILSSEIPAPQETEKDKPRLEGADQSKPQDGNNEKPAPSAREIMNSTSGLYKNQTILLLYANPDVRAEYLVSHLSEYLSPEQVDQAIVISMTFDEDVARLRRERSEILENATDEQNVDQMLLENRKKTFELFSVIRQKVFREVLTKEQKQQIAQKNLKLKKAQ